VKPTKELIDELYRERVRWARETPPEEKFLDGPRLFEYACRIMADGIRNQFPDADEERVQQVVTERLALQDRLEGRQ
jgi:hypothetical protein